MSHPEPPALPEPLDAPDVGFVAAAGVYVAAVLVGASVSLAIAVGGSTSAVVGSVTSAVTVGLVVGALAASRIDGLPERLGRRRRSQIVPFVVPSAFAAASLAALASPSIPRATVVGTGLGTVATSVAAFGLASMARTRYARAMAPDEPLARFSRRNPNAARYWLVGGVVCLGAGSVAVVDGSSPRPWYFWLFAYGLFAILAGLSRRSAVEDRESETGWRPRRRILGSEWFQQMQPDADMLPEVQVHERGLVLKRPLQRRFVPWTDVSDVRLTDEELVVEREGPFDLRCARSAIDDPGAVYEAIQQVRASEAAALE